MCLIISTLLLLRALKVDDSASSLRMKQSSLLTVFSPMQTELVKRLAVVFGSSPCRSKMNLSVCCLGKKDRIIEWGNQFWLD